MGNIPDDPFDPIADHPGAEDLPADEQEILRGTRMAWLDYDALVKAPSLLEMLAGAKALNEDQLRATLVSVILAQHQGDDDPWWRGRTARDDPSG